MRKLVFWILVLAILFFGAKSYWNYLISPVNPNDTNKKTFVIKKSESTTEISDDLVKKGLIRSQTAFGFLLKQSGKSNQIQAGDYLLSPSMSVDEIIKQIISGDVADKWVTLLEGWRDEEMAKKLNDELGVSSDEFIQEAKEGYMFPDTYLFNAKVKVPDIVSILENNFDKKFDSDLQQKISSLGLTRNQAVILASIVEREARSDGVRVKVASILLKRLKIGMALDADSTIQYALGFQKDEGSWWKRNLSLDDLKINSPYNTYTHPGLPPTPICNPSLSSLKAVAEADPSTPYLYYYHDSQGNSYYDRTLEEHNQNVANHP